MFSNGYVYYHPEIGIVVTKQQLAIKEFHQSLFCNAASKRLTYDGLTSCMKDDTVIIGDSISY